MQRHGIHMCSEAPTAIHADTHVATATAAGQVHLPGSISGDTQHAKPEEGSSSLAQGGRHFERDRDVERLLARGGGWDGQHNRGGITGLDSDVGKEVALLEV